MDENTTQTPITPETDRIVEQDTQGNLQGPLAAEESPDTSDANEKAPEREVTQEQAVDTNSNPNNAEDDGEDVFEGLSPQFSIDDDADIDDLDMNQNDKQENEEQQDEDQAPKVQRLGPASTSRRRQLSRRRQQYDDNHERYEEDIQRASVWGKLLQAKREKTVLSGKMSSTMLAPGPNKETVKYGIVHYGGFFRVMIPFSEFFTQDPISRNEDNATATRESIIMSQELILMKMIQAPIQFVVTAMDADDKGNYVVLASRKAALIKQMEENFNPDDSGTAVIMEDDIVPATVLSVGRHAIFANVGGIDMRIAVKNLTWQYLPNHEAIVQKYKVGAVFPVKVLEIRHSDNGNVFCFVSGRRAELDRIKQSNIRMHPDETALGTITYVRIRDDGKSASVFIILEDIGNIPAISSTIPLDPFGNLPQEGDKVRVRFQHYDQDTGITYVRILRVHESNCLY